MYAWRRQLYVLAIGLAWLSCVQKGLAVLSCAVMAGRIIIEYLWGRHISWAAAMQVV